MIERRVANLLAAVAFFAMSLSTAIGAAPASSTTWSFDMYDPAAVLYQDPDYTACASAAAQIMLNTAFDVSEQDYVSSGTEMFHLSMRWQPDTSAATMETIQQRSAVVKSVCRHRCRRIAPRGRPCRRS